MDHQAELECIGRVRGGDHAAYAVLVDRYKRLAYSIALKVLGNEEDAEDVAQEGFIKAFQQLHHFEGKSKFSTWLYTIVYRTALAKVSENRTRLLPITDQLKDRVATGHAAPQLSLMQSDDERRAISAAIDKLPGPEALVVILYYIDENSISEIQQITGLSAANIKIKLFRARKKLERELRFLLDMNTREEKKYGNGKS